MYAIKSIYTVPVKQFQIKTPLMLSKLSKTANAFNKIVCDIITSCDAKETPNLPPHLQLNKINFRKVRRTASKYRPTFTIQRLVFVTDPDVFTEALRAVDLVVTDSQVVPGDPDHGAFGPEGIVLEGSLCELIAFVGREILQFVLDSGK